MAPDDGREPPREPGPCAYLVQRFSARTQVLLLVVPGVACIGALVDGGGGGAFLLALVASGPGLFGTVLAHEIGHLIMASRCGVMPELILLWPMGGLAVTATAAQSHQDQIWIAAAGPSTHFPMCLCWAFLAALASGFDVSIDPGSVDASGAAWFEALFVTMLFINIYLFAFNLLIPCFPLDCSVIAMSAQLIYGRDRADVAICMVYTSCPFIIVLLGWGLYSFFTAGQGAIWIVLGCWIAHQTFLLYTAWKKGTLDAHGLFRIAAQKPERVVWTEEETTQKEPSGDPHSHSLLTVQVGAGTVLCLALILDRAARFGVRLSW